jgi:hypothetical protein
MTDRNSRVRQKKLAAAYAKRDDKHKEKLDRIKLFHAEVGLARLKYGLGLGVLGGTAERVVGVRFDDLLALLERLMPDAEAPEVDAPEIEKAQEADRAAEAVLDEEQGR